MKLLFAFALLVVLVQARPQEPEAGDVATPVKPAPGPGRQVLTSPALVSVPMVQHQVLFYVCR